VTEAVRVPPSASRTVAVDGDGALAEGVEVDGGLRALPMRRWISGFDR
jgi:hypothetical protein